MRFAILLSGFFLTLEGVLLGADFYKVPDGDIPSHLVPARFAGGDSYEELIHKHLVAKWGDGTFGTMVAMPSFAPEYCVSVYADVPKESGKDRGASQSTNSGRQSYIVVASKVSENLNTWASRNARREPVNKIRVAHKERKISSELAVSLQRVWGRALHLTRYPTASSPIETDGARYRFSVLVAGLGMLHGECHSPRNGLTKDLTEIGYGLYELAESDDASASSKEKGLLERLKKLEPKIPKR